MVKAYLQRSCCPPGSRKARTLTSQIWIIWFEFHKLQNSWIYTKPLCSHKKPYNWNVCNAAYRQVTYGWLVESKELSRNRSGRLRDDWVTGTWLEPLIHVSRAFPRSLFVAFIIQWMTTKLVCFFLSSCELKWRIKPDFLTSQKEKKSNYEQEGITFQLHRNFTTK